VFATLNSQPLEDAATRTLIRDGLALPGWPQMLLALAWALLADPAVLVLDEPTPTWTRMLAGPKARDLWHLQP